MENITAFCDSQGFYVRGRFYPRELAFLTRDGKFYNYSFDLSEVTRSSKDERTIKYVQRHIHHLSFYPGEQETSCLPVYLFPEIMKDLCHKHLEDGLLGIRNSFLRIECERLGIPVFNMEQMEVCKLHTDCCSLHKAKNICCNSKVYNLYKSINQKNE